MDSMLLPTHTNSKGQDIFRTISITALLSGVIQLIAVIIQAYVMPTYPWGEKSAGTTEKVSFLDYLTLGGPENVCRTIAKAVFDPSTNEKLLLAWGIVFHFMIAFLFTAVFFLIYPPVARLLKNRFAIAAMYGMITSAIMNLMVIPLTNLGKSFADLRTILVGGLILTCTIGFPVAWNAGRHYLNKMKN